MRQLFKIESAATAIEYAIMSALIAVVIIGAVAAVGLTLDDTYGCVASAVGSLPDADPCTN